MDDATANRTVPRVLLSMALLIAFGAIAVPTVVAADEGRMVYASASTQIIVMNPDGTGQNPILAPTGPLSYLCGNPAWSPDGSKIAFTYNKYGYGDVFVMNADGTGQNRLTTNASPDGDPAWSLDGSRIAFVSSRDGSNEIFVMSAGGTDQTRLTFNLFDEGYPTWSPDSSRIAFTSSRDGNNEIYIMNADGSGQTRLTTNTAMDWMPAWSPDGSHILFSSYRDGNYELYVMNTDGSGQTRLTFNTVPDFDPAWSPDGSQIVYTSGQNNNAEIYIMNADGSGQTRLTVNTVPDHEPAWWGAITSTPTPTPTPTPTSTPLPSAGMTITQPGIYSLDGDGDYGNWDNAILIASSDVVLDGMGYSVWGFNKDGSRGIYVTGGSNAPLHNITIRNISLRYWNRGIEVNGATDFTIENVLSEWNTYGISILSPFTNRGIIRTSTLRNNLLYGADLDYTGLITVEHCSIYSNREGIFLIDAGKESSGDGPVFLTDNDIFDNRDTGINSYASELRIKNSTIRENGGDGIIIDRSYSPDSTIIEGNRIINNAGSAIRSTYKASSSRIISNWITGNTYGIFIGSWESDSYNDVWNNMLNNTDNGNYFGDEWTTHVLNTTKTAGENIVGGPYIGGNFWAYPDGTGFSQTCTDADRDGLCDAPYTADGGRTDYLPLAVSPIAPPNPLLAVPGGSGLPADTNTDGKYDDVNGNGRKDFADVVWLFNHL